jgi:hypothetical protein
VLVSLTLGLNYTLVSTPGLLAARCRSRSSTAKAGIVLEQLNHSHLHLDARPAIARSGSTPPAG